MNKANVFGYPVHLVTQDEGVNYVLDAIDKGQGLHIVTINPEIIAAADKSPELAGILKQAELVIPDSIGMMLAIWSSGFFRAKKLPGIEFSEKLLEKCAEKGIRVGFLGGKPEIIKELNFPGVNVVFSHHGYFKDEEVNDITQQLQASEPQILFVGLGCPKQEYFIKRHRNILKKIAMIGVGGSFDVWAKKVKRAPVLFQAFGLEWFYRLVTQPERFNRMFPVLPLFFLRIVFDRKNLGKKYENE
ncbi:MAG: hypothetical protein A2Y25_02590 [Candidatus Melainabacteria bacterium GWF2_37_15]|nr:MAG: hypothetical protein A2Y25_02590 [Candidatus Melainabacteria bacterium GWF2_37_15]